MFNSLKTLFRPSFRHIIIPDSDCYLCQGSVRSSKPLPNLICEYCHSRLPTLPNGCSICAMPMFGQPTVNSLNTCGSCLKHAPSYSKTVAAFHYEPPINDFITSLKFSGQHHFVPILSSYLLERINSQYLRAELPEAIVPVPLHSSKIKERGFNQALLIAKSLSVSLNIPIITKAVKRTRYTKAQSALNAVQRQRNLKGAFSVSPIKPTKVAIVDDVMTTGTTANELSNSLLQAGVAHIDVWCVARAYTA